MSHRKYKENAKSGVKPRLVQKFKKGIIVFGIVLVLGLLVFAEVVRPNQDAKAYTGRLQAASGPLQTCFEKLSNTTTLDIYGAPDISVAEKQKDVAAIKAQVNKCQAQLNAFNKQAHDLLSLHFAGYTRTYHEAKVNQHQAYDVIGQSGDVLNQYGDVADFLAPYLGNIQAFLNYFQYLQAVEEATYTPSQSTIKTLADQASDLHKRSNDIRSLKANPSFDSMKASTADMFDSTATGFDNIVKGYSNYNDYYKTVGFNQVDKAVSTYDSTVINLPFEQLNASYIPKQVQQLPVKVKNLLAAQSE